MKNLTLACALAGALGLAASAAPVSAAPLSGLKNAPAVQSNTIDVRKRRHTRNHWQHRRHYNRRHYHRRYYGHRYYNQPYGYYYQRPYYSPFPFSLFGL
ncbi:MAG: hypothetical protein KF835_11585 [Xanthobacteraceae bacterium]|nr:hypothetical protein [Xanthobacteraceae bacterium]